jgi:hypothetical protein
MPKGISLHVGLNLVDPNHYQGWSGPLTACEADAADMADIAKANGFTPSSLLTKAATRQAVTGAIQRAAAQLARGDIFFLSYSGHGGHLPDLNGDEDDLQDETWCLYDGELLDDENYDLLSKFAEGVRIIVLSDSCHSGTVTKFAYYYNNMPVALLAASAGAGTGAAPVYRAMPRDVALKTYRANRAFYDKIGGNAALKDAATRVKASTILISGCQDNQLSADGAFNGLFTGTLLRARGDGSSKKGYRDLHSAIVNRMPPDQTPNFFTVGTRDTAFENQAAFTI